MATDTAILEALYNSLDAGGRRRILRSVVQAVRREQGARIARQQDPDGQRFAPRSRAQNRRDQATGPMFRKLRLIRHMVVQAGTDEGIVGFKSRTERIARVHQHGETDAPRPGWRPVRYPERRLLGVSSDTERLVWEALERALLR